MVIKVGSHSLIRHWLVWRSLHLIRFERTGNDVRAFSETSSPFLSHARQHNLWSWQLRSYNISPKIYAWRNSIVFLWHSGLQASCFLLVGCYTEGLSLFGSVRWGEVSLVVGLLDVNVCGRWACVVEIQVECGFSSSGHAAKPCCVKGLRTFDCFNLAVKMIIVVVDKEHRFVFFSVLAWRVIDLERLFGDWRHGSENQSRYGTTAGFHGIPERGADFYYDRLDCNSLGTSISGNES